MKKSNITIVVTHSAYNDSGEITYGPTNHIYDFLSKNKSNAVLISHSLFGGWSSFFQIKNKKTDFGIFHKQNLLFRSIEHIITNLTKTIKLGKGNEITYIGTDPINSFSGLLLKIFNKINKNIYFIVDYTEQRFENKFLNYVYHSLDKLCMKYADEIWCVSTRIINKKIEDGISIDKLKVLPNSPNIKSFPKFTKKRGLNFIIVSHLSKSLDLLPILKSIKIVSKKHSSIKLDIVGTGPQKDEFIKMVNELKLNKNVVFTGQLNHNEVIKQISKSFLGFAIYTDKNSWNYYGDSMKAREYVAGGTPVIINNIPSTADDVRKYKAGKVIKKINPKVIAKFINKCIDDQEYYFQLQKNSLNMSRDFDKNKILAELLLV